MKQAFFLLAILCALSMGAVLALPASRYYLLACLSGEPLYNGRPLGFWTATLNDADPQARRDAALSLAEPGILNRCAEEPEVSRKVVESLTAKLGDSDGQVRKCVATSLLSYPRETLVPDDQTSVAGYLTALKDSEPAVRKAAVRSLWQAGKAAGQADGVARLTVALADRDDFVREYAARTLGRIGPDAQPAVPALLERLAKDEERDVREHAAKSLGLIGAKAIGPLLPETIEALVKGLTDSAADVRENSARSLGQLGARGTMESLRKTCDDPQPRVRAAAVEALKLFSE